MCDALGLAIGSEMLDRVSVPVDALAEEVDGVLNGGHPF